jgi:hypothetical protein
LLFECDRDEGSCAVRNVDEFVLTIPDVDAGQIPGIVMNARDVVGGGAAGS